MRISDWSSDVCSSDLDETAEQGAERELKEEIGYGARKLTILHNLSLSPSYMTPMAHVVLAQDLYPEKLVGDAPEELEAVTWKLSALPPLPVRPAVTEGRLVGATIGRACGRDSG